MTGKVSARTAYHFPLFFGRVNYKILVPFVIKIFTAYGLQALPILHFGDEKYFNN
jgi:hypothetical protein